MPYMGENSNLNHQLYVHVQQNDQLHSYIYMYFSNIGRRTSDVNFLFCSVYKVLSVSSEIMHFLVWMRILSHSDSNMQAKNLHSSYII